jgi:hypothetical protein
MTPAADLEYDNQSLLEAPRWFRIHSAKSGLILLGRRLTTGPGYHHTAADARSSPDDRT